MRRCQSQGQVGEGRKEYRWRRPRFREEAPYPRLPTAQGWEARRKLETRYPVFRPTAALPLGPQGPLICPRRPCPRLPEQLCLTLRLGREGTIWSLCLRKADRELFPQPSFWKGRTRNRPSRGALRGRLELWTGSVTHLSVLVFKQALLAFEGTVVWVLDVVCVTNLHQESKGKRASKS